MDAEDLKEHIQRFFGDTSRSREETKAGLEELRDHIDMLLETLED